MADPPSSSNATAVTMADTAFPFMKLPRELHDHVYDCYFEDIAVMDTKTKRRYWFDTILDPKQEKSTSIPRRTLPVTMLRPYLAILHSSSQTRSEAAPIFYKQHIGGADLQLAVLCSVMPPAFKLLSKFCSSVDSLQHRRQVYGRLRKSLLRLRQMGVHEVGGGASQSHGPAVASKR